MTPERYQNLNGDSGVTHYAIGSDFIAVQFRDSTVYLYYWVRPGRSHVEQMMAHAIAGRGLGTYISRHVRKAFARKQQNW
jgi:hypothetical protein